MTTAPLPAGLGVRTRLVEEPGRLLDLLPDAQNPLCWLREGEGVVGWGEVARFTGVGASRFADADVWWRRFVAKLDVTDEVGVPGTGPLAFASFTFADDSPGSVLVVPRVVVGRRGGVCWITEFSGDGPSAVWSVSPVQPSGPIRYSDGEMTVAGYRSAVAEAARRLGGDANHVWTAFGPTNVAIHRVATAIELGDIQVAIDLGPALDTSALPIERRARHGIAVAQAYSMWNRTDEALDAILQAERLAPEQIRQHYLSRQLVLRWMRRQKGKPSRRLVDLARRLHLA